MSLDKVQYIVKTSPRRKRISFRALDVSHLEVLIPQGISSNDIKQIIIRNEEAILRILNNAKDRQISMNYQDGAKILFHGREIPLFYRDLNDATWVYRVESNSLHIAKKYQSRSPEVLNDFYDAQSPYLKNRCLHLARLHDLSPKRISLRWTSSKWGSCSLAGNINLSKYLIMSPRHIQDYIILHELCHLIHPDHSQNFYAKLEEFDPDYREHWDWLKQNGWRLRILPQS